MTDKAAARGSVWSDNQRVEMQQNQSFFSQLSLTIICSSSAGSGNYQRMMAAAVIMGAETSNLLHS